MKGWRPLKCFYRRSPASYVELKTAAVAVFFGGQEGISSFCVDLEMAMKSTIYIHKQHKAILNSQDFLPYWDGIWWLRNWNKITKIVCRTACKGSVKVPSFIKRTLLTVVSVLMYYCNKSYCHHKRNTMLLSDSRAGQTRTLEKDFCEIQRSEFVTQSQTKQKDNFIKVCTAFFLWVFCLTLVHDLFDGNY